MHPKRSSRALYAALLSTFLTAFALISAPALAKNSIYDKRFEKYGNKTAAQILGVADSDVDDYEAYKKAFRKLAQIYHADKNLGDSSNDDRMVAINAAWDYVDKLERARKVAIMEAEEAEENRTQQPQAAAEDLSETLMRASKAYANGRQARDAELMQVLNDNYRLGDERPVIALLERRYKADVDNLLFVFTQNLYLGPASELLLKSSIKYLFAKYPQFADSMVEIYYKQLETRLEMVEPGVSTSEEARRQGNQLLSLLHTLEKTRLESGRKPRKVRPGKPSCEENVRTRSRN